MIQNKIYDCPLVAEHLVINHAFVPATNVVVVDKVSRVFAVSSDSEDTDAGVYFPLALSPFNGKNLQIGVNFSYRGDLNGVKPYLAVKTFVTDDPTDLPITTDSNAVLLPFSESALSNVEAGAGEEDVFIASQGSVLIPNLAPTDDEIQYVAFCVRNGTGGAVGTGTITAVANLENVPFYQPNK